MPKLAKANLFASLLASARTLWPYRTEVPKFGRRGMSNSSASNDTVNHGSATPPRSHEKLLPDSMDFSIYGNLTANQVLSEVVNTLDGGPNSVSPETTAFLVLCTPIILFVCISFMRQCHRRPCCGGACFYYWFNCTGYCKHLCGGETLLSGTEPATGLQPDEESYDPDVILGDEDYVGRDPPMPPSEEDLAQPQSTASEISDEEGGSDSETSYSKDCRQCCATVASCLENGENGNNGSSESNGMLEGPAVSAARKAKGGGRGKKK